ncbi:hypothetical protein Tco_0815482, partial [Tanacetum coccineum]
FETSPRFVERITVMLLEHQDVDTEFGSSPQLEKLSEETRSRDGSRNYRSLDSPDIDCDVPHHEWMSEDQASIVPEYQDHTLAYASAAFDEGSPSIGSSSSPFKLQLNFCEFMFHAFNQHKNGHFIEHNL